MGGGGGGGPFQGCYPPGGPPQHLQGDPERLLPPQTREEIFRALEKRQLQALHRLELDRLAKQQQQQQQQAAFPNSGMGGGPPPLRGDPMDFPGSRGMMGSPMGGAGGGGSLREGLG
ncbi:hypothetical protein SKAU_G00323660 [Synaphobranchus kaupii]|uniref:Uncharacterized protein n=1 Tax=Synaphobranchus kaupii TaxID=118154 RepID=A0A9Q1EPB8_SYNKA|nr:hypothetical protein SKAU_G00323660 [Synaphobranchus kaupii]